MRSRPTARARHAAFHRRPPALDPLRPHPVAAAGTSRGLAPRRGRFERQPGSATHPQHAVSGLFPPPPCTRRPIGTGAAGGSISALGQTGKCRFGARRRSPRARTARTGRSGFEIGGESPAARTRRTARLHPIRGAAQSVQIPCNAPLRPSPLSPARCDSRPPRIRSAVQPAGASRTGTLSGAAQAPGVTRRCAPVAAGAGRGAPVAARSRWRPPHTQAG